MAWPSRVGGPVAGHAERTAWQFLPTRGRGHVRQRGSLATLIDPDRVALSTASPVLRTQLRCSDPSVGPIASEHVTGITRSRIGRDVRAGPQRVAVGRACRAILLGKHAAGAVECQQPCWHEERSPYLGRSFTATGDALAGSGSAHLLVWDQVNGRRRRPLPDPSPVTLHAHVVQAG